ncbi:MAG: YraN family protein [Lachnospiraceae bacterium]
MCKGYSYRCRFEVEIDPVARDGAYLVFVEVKYRERTRGWEKEAVR